MAFLSLANGKYFEPLAAGYQSRFTAIRHILYRKDKFRLLRMGAVQPIASDNRPGKNADVEVTLKLKTAKTRANIKPALGGKSAAPLILEVVVRDDSNSKQSTASLRVW